ncbi:hypothetical protein [Bradyrhizobium sp. 2S1]|uniref:hypothetical protein n=1 Tax=Bradyrhizobium sp. 2S1 TaxID=1404429 RepID=UPI00140E531D|nr:hypothetical protein [Bradyrhizobium sp. 2S1]MCK7665019.1 hypothetical protein [Bradyrhizobium sp. 2S1]
MKVSANDPDCPNRATSLLVFALDFYGIASIHGVTGEHANGCTSRRNSRPDGSDRNSHSYKAAGIARAADACAGAGFCDKPVEISLDIEQPLYEATTLLNAVSLINRICRDS